MFSFLYHYLFFMFLFYSQWFFFYFSLCLLIFIVSFFILHSFYFCGVRVVYMWHYMMFIVTCFTIIFYVFYYIYFYIWFHIISYKSLLYVTLFLISVLESCVPIFNAYCIVTIFYNNGYKGGISRNLFIIVFNFKHHFVNSRIYT